jgi:cytochrome c-type biogenesis protein CcmH/NrfG
MSSSEKIYIEKQEKKARRLRMIVGWVSIVSFVGSTATAVVPTLLNSINQNPTQQVISAESALRKQAQGFEMVLQKEPENQAALQGLANTKIELKDFKGAKEPLEKLVKLNPNKPEYKIQLEDLQKQQSK